MTAVEDITTIRSVFKEEKKRINKLNDVLLGIRSVEDY